MHNEWIRKTTNSQKPQYDKNWKTKKEEVKQNTWHIIIIMFLLFFFSVFGFHFFIMHNFPKKTERTQQPAKTRTNFKYNLFYTNTHNLKLTCCSQKFKRNLLFGFICWRLFNGNQIWILNLNIILIEILFLPVARFEQLFYEISFVAPYVWILNGG